MTTRRAAGVERTRERASGVGSEYPFIGTSGIICSDDLMQSDMYTRPPSPLRSAMMIPKEQKAKNEEERRRLNDFLVV